MIIPDADVTTREVTSWRGLHLLHFRSSSCSQKVRVLLREKGLAYTSHPVNRATQKHVSAWYLGINPRGVVPTLVHDGVVHVESNDILEHLDALPSDAEPPETARASRDAHRKAFEILDARLEDSEWLGSVLMPLYARYRRLAGTSLGDLTR